MVFRTLRGQRCTRAEPTRPSPAPSRPPAATGQVINIVPTLLEQLLAYADGSVTDPVLESVLTPSTELTADQRETLVSWAFHVDPRQLARYPRLGELASRKPDASSENRLTSRYGPGDLRDLQVLFVLAHAGEQAWTDERLVPLYRTRRQLQRRRPRADGAMDASAAHRADRPLASHRKAAGGGDRHQPIRPPHHAVAYRYRRRRSQLGPPFSARSTGLPPSRRRPLAACRRSLVHARTWL